MRDLKPQGTARHKSRKERFAELWGARFPGSSWLGGHLAMGLLMTAILFVGLVFMLWGKPFMGGEDVGLFEAVGMAALLLPVVAVSVWLKR